MTARPISAHQPVLDPLREELLGGVVRLAGPGLVAAPTPRRLPCRVWAGRSRSERWHGLPGGTGRRSRDGGWQRSGDCVSERGGRPSEQAAQVAAVGA
jgi:hypothetical protein